jgi:hypothetical protein
LTSPIALEFEMPHLIARERLRAAEVSTGHKVHVDGVGPRVDLRHERYVVEHREAFDVEAYRHLIRHAESVELSDRLGPVVTTGECHWHEGHTRIEDEVSALGIDNAKVPVDKLDTVSP